MMSDLLLLIFPKTDLRQCIYIWPPEMRGRGFICRYPHPNEKILVSKTAAEAVETGTGATDNGQLGPASTLAKDAEKPKE